MCNDQFFKRKLSIDTTIETPLPEKVRDSLVFIEI